VATVAGALAVAGLLAWALAGQREEFGAALRSAPVWILLVAAALQLLALVLVAVSAQILRNWLMLHAVGVDASVFDATAVLIAMVTLSQLPVGPSVGAAAVVLILGANGVALTAAAGVLLTVTGTVGALCFAGWAAVDSLQPAVPALPVPPIPAVPATSP